MRSVSSGRGRNKKIEIILTSEEASKLVDVDDLIVTRLETLLIRLKIRKPDVEEKATTEG